MDALTWGFIPHWTKDLKAAAKPINARAETVATSGMFRKSVAARRCMVPADAFYEWHRTEAGKQPYAMARRNGEPIMFAGLWDGWRGPSGEVLKTYAIITTAANAMMTPIHNRIPAILEPDAWPVWLGEAEGDHLAALRPAGEGVLQAVAVDKAVGNVWNNGAELLNPI